MCKRSIICSNIDASITPCGLKEKKRGMMVLFLGLPVLVLLFVLPIAFLLLVGDEVETLEVGESGDLAEPLLPVSTTGRI